MKKIFSFIQILGPILLILFVGNFGDFLFSSLFNPTKILREPALSASIFILSLLIVGGIGLWKDKKWAKIISTIGWILLFGMVIFFAYTFEIPLM